MEIEEKLDRGRRKKGWRQLAGKKNGESSSGKASGKGNGKKNGEMSAPRTPGAKGYEVLGKEKLQSSDGGKKSKKAERDAAAAELREEVDMWEHKITSEELASRLNTDLTNGLTQEEALIRLEKYGKNVLSPPKVTPWWKKFLAQFTNLFAVLLELAGVLCFVSFALEPERRDDLYLGIILITVVTITAIFSFLQEHKSEQTMEKFKNFLPPKTLVTRDGHAIEEDAENLVVGDVVQVQLGDKIPADIGLIAVSKLKVDNSSLTGESEPLSRTEDCTDENPLETSNLAFFGTMAVDGTATGIVVRTGDQTVFGRIAGLATSSGMEETTLQREIHHFVVLISVVAVTLGVSFFVIGIIKGANMIDNIVFCIGIIVANVPEGLLATVTVALTLTAMRMAKKNVLVKKLECVETLGSTTTICSDKTGTLTQNRMTIMHLMYGNEIYTSRTATTAATYDTNDPLFQELFLGACLCGKAVFDKQDMENHPDMEIDERKVNGDASEAGILKFCEKITQVGEVRRHNPQLSGIPFNSTNKFMVTIHEDQTNQGRCRLVMKGAPERVVDRCTRILTRSGVREMTAEDREAINRHLDTLMSGGERVLGFAQRLLPESVGPSYDFQADDEHFLETMTNGELCFVGLMSLLDPPRESVPYAVSVCQDAGIQVIMVTGDHPQTAKSIAKSVNILKDPTVEDIAKERNIPVSEVNVEEVNAIVVPGSQIRDLDMEDWDRILAKEQIVFARTSPQQKLIIVENCQRLGKIVAVTGDGVNDSPALKKANIGVAMGIAGSDVSKEAADMILLDDNFSSIVSGVEEGRLIFDNLKKSIAYTLTSNIPEITPFIMYSIFAIPHPLTTVLILFIDLGTDMLPAIALAYEKAERDIMMRAPRDAKTDHLVNRRLIVFSYLQIGILQGLAGMFSYFVVFNDYGLSPRLLFGLENESYFADKSVADQRWLFTQRPDVSVPPYDRTWFANTTEFKTYIQDDPPVGFIQQETFLFSELPTTAVTSYDDLPEIFDIVPGIPASDQFNNMMKIIGKETSQPPCLQYVCAIDGQLAINNMACFDSDINEGPVYVNGINTGAINSQVRPLEPEESGTGCFEMWSVPQQQVTLSHAQCAFFICIIVVQISDLLICKTRSLSLFQQGMKNKILNIGLFEETALAALIVYLPFLNKAFGTAPIRFVHWLLGVPFSILELVYDETRKGFIRFGDRTGNPFGVWVRENTYW